MTGESSLREIQKLRVRIKNFLKEETRFVESLSVFLDKLETLSRKVKSNDLIENVLQLRMDAYEALNDALNRQSVVEHEVSHLPESLGLLLLAMEKELQETFKVEYNRSRPNE